MSFLRKREKNESHLVTIAGLHCVCSQIDVVRKNVCVCVLCVVMSAPLAHTSTHVRGWEVTQLSCPVSTKLTKSAEDWSGNSGSPCCLMCLCVVVVSPFRLCHITRVYVGFFSFLTCFIRCPSQRRLTVVFVLSSVCVRGLFVFFNFHFSLFSDFFCTVFLFGCSSAHPRGLHLGRGKHAAAHKDLICQTPPPKKNCCKLGYRAKFWGLQSVRIVPKKESPVRHALDSKFNSGQLCYSEPQRCATAAPLGSEEPVRVQGRCFLEHTPCGQQQGVFFYLVSAFTNKYKKSHKNLLAVREVRTRRCSLDRVPICVFSAWCGPRVEFRL